MHNDSHSVMIVDDEILALQHLEGLIPWEQLGYRLVARTTSAREALDLFVKKKPTIIVADISMPDINGIDLMTKILAYQIPVRFIFLTAYREFNYIQSAMQLGASGFILKHDLKAALLQKELAKAAQDLSLELQRRLANADSETCRMQQRELWMIVATDTVFPVVGPAQAEQLIVPADQIRCIDFNQYHFIDYAQVADVRPQQCLLSIKIKSYFSQLALLEELRRFCKQLQTIFTVTLDCTISIASCVTPLSPADKEKQIKQLYELMDQRFFIGHACILFVGFENLTLLQNKQAKVPIPAEIVEMLEMDKSTASVLASMFQSVRGDMPRFITLVQYLVSELDRLRRKLEYPSLYEMLTAGAINTKLWVDAPGIQRWFQQEYGILREKMEKNLCAFSSKAAKGLELIQHHYHQDISLEWVAQQLGISNVYLLKLLKMETGKTFTELLTERRMEIAGELLSQRRIKTQELAEKLGYHSSQYFSTVFKKYFGCTPQEYRSGRHAPKTS